MAELPMDILDKKAVEVQQHLSHTGYHCTYILIQNGINFSLYLANRIAKFTLYHRAKKNTWNLYSVDEWVNSELKPKLDLLLGLQSTTSVRNAYPIQPLSLSHVEPSAYFATALEYFRILQPFALEYVDFSVIGEQTKLALKCILADSRYVHLNQQALQAALTTPLTPDFLNSKEYLIQCLTLCQLQMQL